MSRPRAVGPRTSMPHVNPLTHSFVPIALMVGMSALTGVGILLLSFFAGGGRSSHAGDTAYECGLDPMDAQGKRFPIKFYVVAMLFILFDVEIALLYPWAIYFGRIADTPALRLFAYAELLVFAGILVAGYVYLYRSGAFDWAKLMGRRAPSSSGNDATADKRRRAA